MSIVPPRRSSCDYVLHAVGQVVNFEGTSTCDGLPQDTGLQIPQIAQALFTQAELVTVLIAVLSVPPATLTESMAFSTSPSGLDTFP